MQPYGYSYTPTPMYYAGQPVPQQTFMQPQMQQPQQPTMPQPIRSGGIVSIPSEEDARRYPVAPGYTVTMRDENAPYLYEKTMGFSQLEPPIFRKAKIEFEDADPQADAGAPECPQPVYVELEQMEALRGAVAADIRDVRDRIDREVAEIRSLVAAMIKPDDGKRTAKKKEADEE